MITLKVSSSSKIFLSLFCLCCCFTLLWAFEGEEEAWGSSLVVKKDERRTVLVTEFGEISAVEIGDGARVNGSYNLQFFKLEPNALFLPVMLHAEMLLYCHSGSGDLTWIDHGKKSATVSLSRGDVFRLRQGSVFFIRSNLGTAQRERLRLTALFANSNEDLHSRFSLLGPYSSIADLVRGFDSSVLQAAFQVPEEAIQAIKSAAKQPLIIQDVSSQPEDGQSWDWEGRFMRVFLSIHGAETENKKKKKKHKESSAFNVYTADRDFENCNGWSLTVTPNDLEVFKDSNFGAFYVNLTKGAMMAPHWNPMATEIAFVVAGQGMVRIVCSQLGCEKQSFKVEEGDVFLVPRFHPMSQTSFNNESFIFMGFSTASKRNHPQYLVGKESVFQAIDKDVLAAAFNVDNETIVKFSGQQEEALIVECTSCAEEQYSLWQEEESKRKEEARKREEEEARKREEEARKKEEEEEEEARKREEEEARKREEEEEARKREEEEARKREEEEEARKKEEEETRKREEKEARKREEEEEARKREEEEAREREEEEEERRSREEEEAKRKEEEEKEAREEEERKQREGEKEAREEEERKQREEEGGESEEEAARREEEEMERREREEEHGRGGGEAMPKRQQQQPEEEKGRKVNRAEPPLEKPCRKGSSSSQKKKKEGR